MPTAYIAVRGGLGNQMFQAAFGVAIAARLGVEVAFLSDYVDVDPYGRRFMLDRFPRLRGRTVPLSAADGVAAYGEQGVEEASLAHLFREQPSAALHGYWQHERFFMGETAAVAAAFAEPEVAPATLVRGGEIAASGAIGVHMRRTEYGHHGLASADYYRDAIAAIRAERGPAPVLCFTDEPNVARFVFQAIPDLTVLEPDTADPLDDFHLLSRCRHFVLANSSFSWWAAWLGAAADAIVYAPSPWCAYDPTQAPAAPGWRVVENAVRGP